MLLHATNTALALALGQCDTWVSVDYSLFAHKGEKLCGFLFILLIWVKLNWVTQQRILGKPDSTHFILSPPSCAGATGVSDEHSCTWFRLFFHTVMKTVAGISNCVFTLGFAVLLSHVLHETCRPKLANMPTHICTRVACGPIRERKKPIKPAIDPPSYCSRCWLPVLLSIAWG